MNYVTFCKNYYAVTGIPTNLITEELFTLLYQNSSTSQQRALIRFIHPIIIPNFVLHLPTLYMALSKLKLLVNISS